MKYTINRKNYTDFNVICDNRLPKRSYFIPFLDREKLLDTSFIDERTQSDGIVLLSGEWDFKYYKKASQLKSVIDTDTLDFDKVNVPSTWQKTGYDKINYLNSMYPFRCNPPKTPKNCPVAIYRKKFELQKQEDFTYILTFLGVCACVELYINGTYIGYGEGSHNSSEFDITSAVKQGSNELVAVVYKWSTGTYLECQDMFRENGIFRDVYITKAPKNYIYDYHFSTEKTDKGYNAFVSTVLHTDGGVVLNAQLMLNGKIIAQSECKNGETSEFKNLDVTEWNSEAPVCYDLILTLYKYEKPLQCLRQKVGFCTVRLDGCRYLFNEKAIKLKGVNHHDTHPLRGYAMTADDLKKDVELMKEYNVNCLRTSHYPPDPVLLTLCDMYGIYVVDEADIETHGCFVKNIDMISNNPKWKNHYLDRVSSLFERDKNHPCIVMWSMGNEAGGISNFDSCYEYLKTKSQIPVHYEPACRSKRIRYDILAYFYTPVDEMRALARGEWKDGRYYDAPFFLCEYAHSMGVGPGGLDEYMDVFLSDDRFLGGCIWEWADHSHYDENAKYKWTYGGDHNDRLNSGNFCCDGLFYPDRRPSTSALCMKNVYCPLRAERIDGKFYIKNTNYFTDTQNVHITCDLMKNGERYTVFETDDIILPQEMMQIPISAELNDNDDAFLIFTYTKSDGSLLGQNQLSLQEKLPSPSFVNQKFYWKTDSDSYSLNCKNTKMQWHKKGYLLSLTDKNGSEVLKNGSGFIPMLYQAVLDNHTYVASSLKKAGIDRLKCTSYKGSFDEYLNTVTEKIILSAKGKKCFSVELIQKAVENNAICVNVTFQSLVKKPLDMLQMGLVLPLNGKYNRVRYYGMGDSENYDDFSTQSVMGIYDTTVSDMFTEYIKPQESGNRSGVRFAEITDKHGSGIRITALEKPLSFKAVDVDEENLRISKHIEDVVHTDTTFVHINGFMRGIGSQSCGPDTDKKYRKVMHLNEEFSYSFKLELI